MSSWEPLCYLPGARASHELMGASNELTGALTPFPYRGFRPRGIGHVHARGGHKNPPRDRPGPFFGSPGPPERGVGGHQRKLFTKPLPSRTFGRLKAMADRPCSDHSQPENYAASLSPPALVLTGPSFHITKGP